MAEKVFLFNTLGRKKQYFSPTNPPKVRLYTCGPTVYNFAHVGNFRMYVFEDILRRVLELAGYEVRHVMNITDVGHLVSDADTGEDKMEVGAAREGKTAWEIADFYTKAFFEDAKSLNLLYPTVVPKATEHIPEMIHLIQELEKKGCVYRLPDGIYYDTSKFSGYARLAGEENIKGLKAGARIEQVEGKKNPTDFALWKFSPSDKKRHMEWDSPWGKGFPGWHIECSAMAIKHLGETLDIHCGGVDHVAVHHTNEIAQAEPVTGKPFSCFWLHGEFLVFKSEKMAKSAGEFLTLRLLKEKGFDPLAHRYFCLTAHYRSQLEFSWEALKGAESALTRLRDRAQVLTQEAREHKSDPGRLEKFRSRFRERLFDDLDAPGALAVLWDSLHPEALNAASQLSFLKECDGVLGLDLFKNVQEDLPSELQALVEEREQARKEKDFEKADSIRKKLAQMGVLLEDTPSGPRWKWKDRGVRNERL